jgi:prepilin-type N-terminal cleavage/methylation domain-containing protein
MKRHKNTKQAGFTLIELMVSTVVFSLVLLASTVALVQIGRLYYRGVTQARTQELARAITDEITQAVQFSAQDIRPPAYPGGVSTYGPNIPASNVGPDNDTFYFCVGSKRYSFALDRKLTAAPAVDKKEKKHVLWVDAPATGCAESAIPITPADLTLDVPTGDGRELLADSMRITRLEIVGGQNGLWTVHVSVAYGDEELFAISSDNRKICEGSRFGIEFCATSEISSTALRRVQ